MKDVLIIGAGGIGKRHIRGFLKTGRARLSVVEPHEGRRNEVLKDCNVETGYTDMAEADLKTFDLAVICAPAHVHVPLALACARADLPFLLEKPLAVTMDGVDSMIEEVNNRGLVARVGYVRRTGREMQEMRQQILDGKIGKLRLCYINCSQDFPKYRPDYRSTYYAKRETGGGAMLDAASHLVDVLLWIFGPPFEVSAMYDRMQLQEVECEDACLISVRFKNGCMAQINMNQFQKPNEFTIEVVGTKGNLLLDMATLKYAGDDSGTWDEHDYAAGKRPGEMHEARFALQAEMMMDAIEGKACCLTTLDEARDNLRIILAARESYATKKIICL